MKNRKTIDIAFLKEAANEMLARTDVSDDFRKGVYVLLEAALQNTGNYKGFNYLSWIEKEGREHSGVEQWRKDNADQGFGVPGTTHEYESLSTEPYLGNQTRRFYY